MELKVKKLIIVLLLLFCFINISAQVVPIGGQSNYTNNSIHEILIANETWTPSGFYTLPSYASTIAIVVYSDVSSAIDGIVVKQSPTPAQNWIKIDKFTYSIGGNKSTNIFYVPVQYKYIKVEYTNGDTAQTIMEMTTSVFIYPQTIKTY
jgi:hypothetical protein